MRAVCQRVSRARVMVDEALQAEIAHGLVVLVGIARGDTEDDAERLAGKIAKLRVFEGDDGKFARSVLDVRGAALVVSQFTLLADTRKGHRPSFTAAAPPDEAFAVYERFCTELASAGVEVRRGRFGAPMAVELVNDGPVTIVLD
jgi:D-aminoacyl-tRNA deacylase